MRADLASGPADVDHGVVATAVCIVVILFAAAVAYPLGWWS